MSKQTFEADKKLLKSAKIDTYIPQNSNAEFSELIGESSDQSDGDGALLNVVERDLLFFDENVRTLVVFQLQQCNESTLKSILSRLELRIDVWAINQTNVDGKVTPVSGYPRDVVFSQVIPQTDDPTVLLSQSDEGDERQQFVTLVWEVIIRINRPRMRIPEPVISIIPYVTVSQTTLSKSLTVEYLTPFEALDSNILDPMRNMAGLKENPPYLAASSLERVVPKPKAPEHKSRIPNARQQSYKVVPAAVTRMRYNRTTTGTPTLAMAASLDIEMIPFVDLEASVENVVMSLANGKVDFLMPGSLPMECRSRDSLTYLYNLHPATDQSGSLNPTNPLIPLTNPSIDVLSVSIQIKVHLTDSCLPVVNMEWITNVDFSQALNPSFGPPGQPIQRTYRPPSLPFAPTTDKQSISTNLQPVTTSLADTGLSVSFTAPQKSIKMGETFSWQVLVANRSSRTAKLTIVPLPRVHRVTSQAQHFARRHAPKSSTASFHPTERRHTRGGEEFDIAQAIVDENVVYAIQHSHVLPPETDLMALTSELRIGPLNPGQYHESVINMVAFTTGALRADVVRVIDLVREAEEGPNAAGVVTDIRELPDIIIADEP